MPFEKSVLVPLEADETFALITEPARLRRWQAVTARVDLRVGGEYRWTIIPGNTAGGTFTEVEPGKRVVFSWGWEGSAELPSGASTVTITLEPADGGTVVRLVHEGLTDEQAASHAEGWNHYLGRLVTAGADGEAGADPWFGFVKEMTPLQVAEAALAACQLVLRGAEASREAKVASCPEFTMAQLAEHLLGSVTSLGGAAGAQFPTGADPARPMETAIADAAQPALEAWTRRGLDGTVSVGGMELPATIAASILGIEFLVHAWDFAQVTGQQFTVPDLVVQHVLDAARTIISPGFRAGRFADEVPAGPDAGLLDRLVAFTGRAA
ncbi:MAG: TIGR03086 family metal-binding protein [Actinomycetota bacterium]